MTPICQEYTGRRFHRKPCLHPALWRITQTSGARASFLICGVHIRRYRSDFPNGWRVEKL